MTPLRRATLVLMSALAAAGTGCDAPESTPTGPSSPAPPKQQNAAPAPAPPDGDGRVTSMAVAPGLGTAGTFAVLGASAVTNTGPSLLNGDLGVSPGSSVSGFFPPGIFTGTLHAADAQALQAQDDVTTAFNALSSQACDTNLTGVDLGGLTLTPGVYCFFSSAQLTGTLTLDGLGDPNSVWVFKIASTLTTASGSQVAYINGGRACGTFWRVGSSVTLGTTTNFSGHVLALVSITLNTGATSDGGLYARTGAVTLDTNTVTLPGVCGVGAPAGVPALPPAAAVGLLVALLGGGRFLLRPH